MTTVGIIANPASGKDVRRLVTRASTFYNNQKTNIMQRVLVALDAVGVDQVAIMPDYNYMGKQALEGLYLSLHASILSMPVLGTEADSTRAAELMRDMGARCIVTLGGDGTNRAVAKGCGQVPIVPISTGTNNVFAQMMEGTIAGLAAGLVATEVVAVDKVTYPAKRLELYFGDELVDIALIDIVTCVDTWMGARAVWDLTHVHEIVLARAEPINIGWSSVGGYLEILDARDRRGMYLALGEGDGSVLAPVAPGLIVPVPICERRLLALGDEVPIDPGIGTIALDGEREIEVARRQQVRVRLTDNGPRVVDIRRCVEEAVLNGVLEGLGALAVRPYMAPPPRVTVGAGDDGRETQPAVEEVAQPRRVVLGADLPPDAPPPEICYICLQPATHRMYAGFLWKPVCEVHARQAKKRGASLSPALEE